MKLPEGYRLERDPDIWTLIGPGGEVVARFGPGADPVEVEKEAWEHHEG